MISSTYLCDFVNRSLLTENFHVGDHVVRKSLSDYDYGVVTRIHHDCDEMDVLWHEHVADNQSKPVTHRESWISFGNCSKMFDSQSMGDEPLYSMFDRKYNVFNDCDFNGNNTINQTVNEFEFEANINSNTNNNNNTSNNTNNQESNINTSQNPFELIIERGVINALQSQLFELYSNTGEYVSRYKFNDIKRPKQKKPKIADGSENENKQESETASSESGFESDAHRRKTAKNEKYHVCINDTLKFFEENPIKSKMEEYFILLNIANLKENMKQRSDALKQQLEKQCAKIDSVIGVQYITLPLIDVKNLENKELYDILYGINCSLFVNEDIFNRHKYNPLLTAILKPLFQFLSSLMMLPPSHSKAIGNGDQKDSIDGAEQNLQENSTMAEETWKPDFTESNFIGISCFFFFFWNVFLFLTLFFLHLFFFLFLVATYDEQIHHFGIAMKIQL